ncbi:MAG: ECF-type sigma factor [Bacteroidota bacterium]
MSSRRDHVTALLAELSRSNRAAVDALLPVVYGELRALAHRQLRGQRAGHTLQTTALVHEAYLKLVRRDEATWESRAHFLSVAAMAMRQILINYARERQAAKRGGGQALATFNDEVMGNEAFMGGRAARADDLIALDEALDQLATLSERQSQVVTYRFFGGLTHEETAAVLGCSVPTVRRDWRIAKAWLSRELTRDD